MNGAIRTRGQDLALALRLYVAGEDEQARLEAYEIARDAMSNGAGLLEVVADHQEALVMVLSESRTPEESDRWVRASSSLLSESLGPFEMAQRGYREAIEALVKSNRDLEEQIVERRLAEAAAEVSRDEADRANQAKSEFLSRMSHELRTPLNAVLGFAQLLEWEPLQPEQRQGVEQIIKAGRHLLDLINEVLDIARIEAGRMALTVEPVQVDDVVEEILELVSPLAAGRAITLNRASAPNPVAAVADHKRLRQVLLNLLSNAIKYNDDGGTVTIWTEELSGDRLRIVVADTGRGIDADKMERLFSPFDRLGVEETGIEGTGLGLALSRALVDAMGGRLEATSDPGVGSTFTVELRLAGTEASERGSRHEARPAGEPDSTVGTVLYVEDDPANVALVRQALRARPGVTVHDAARAREGLELARAHRPDLILLDLHLPDMPGEEVLRLLREEPGTRPTPVLVLSADATPARRGQLQDMGATDYLTKPLDIGEFLRVVDSLLRRSGRPETSDDHPMADDRGSLDEPAASSGDGSAHGGG